MTSRTAQALSAIQCKLNAPKNLYNEFGRYSYRSCEGILEALKPMLESHGATLVLCDEIVSVPDRIYVKATATFNADPQERCISASAFAREQASKKGMDEAQITGSASSYARKYALNGLFLIDDTKDPDSKDNRDQSIDKSKDKPKGDQKGAVNKALGQPYFDSLRNHIDNDDAMAFRQEWDELKERPQIQEWVWSNFTTRQKEASRKLLSTAQD